MVAVHRQECVERELLSIATEGGFQLQALIMPILDDFIYAALVHHSGSKVRPFCRI